MERRKLILVEKKRIAGDDGRHEVSLHVLSGESRVSSDSELRCCWLRD